MFGRISASAPGRGLSILEVALATAACLIPSLATAANDGELAVITLPAEPIPDASGSQPALDEDDLARALERSLVLSGGFVLPPGRFDLSAGVTYDYSRRRQLVLLPNTISQQDVRVENLLPYIGLKAGLPGQAQIEVQGGYPFQFVERITGGQSESAEDGDWGDIRLGLSKQLLNHVHSSTGLILNLSYRWAAEPSRQTQDPQISLGAGFDAWGAALTAVRRADPMVLVASANFSHRLADDETQSQIEPGNAYGLSLQALLAASPEMSLRSGFTLSRTDTLEFSGEPVPGSAQEAGSLQLGLAMVLNQRMLFDLSLAAGLTGDAPDFGLAMSLSVRI